MQMTFGERLAFYRKRKGWTQKQLAEYLKVSVSTVSNYEKNVTRPDAETLLQIAGAFELSVSQLLNLRSPQVENKALFERLPLGAKAPDAEEEPLLGRRLICYGREGMKSPKPIRCEALEQFVDDYTKHFCMETQQGLTLFYIQSIAEPGDLMLIRQNEKPPRLAVFDGKHYSGCLETDQIQVLGKKIASTI